MNEFSYEIEVNHSWYKNVFHGTKGNIFVPNCSGESQTGSKFIAAMIFVGHALSAFVFYLHCSIALDSAPMTPIFILGTTEG